MSENDDYLRPWTADMLRVGAVDNRGNPSGRALAKMAGASNATVTRMLQGTTEPQPATVQKVADALELDALEVWRRLGATLNHVEPFEPPAESSLLTPRERRLVSEMIRVLVEGRNDRHAAGEEVDDRPLADGATTQMSDRGLRLVSDDVDPAILEMPYAADEEKPGDDPGEDHH